MEKVQKVYIGSTSNQGIAEYDFQNGELIRRKWTTFRDEPVSVIISIAILSRS